jgi:single-stranded-DNA-specific exonuclease
LQQKTAALPRTQFIDSRHDIMGYLDVCKIDYHLFEGIEYFQPFGHKFEKPSFLCTGHFTEIKKLGKDKNHYSMVFNTYTGCKIRCLWFFFTDEVQKDKKYNIVFTLNKDDYNKDDPQSVCIHIKTIMSEQDMEEKNITVGD